MNEPIIYEPGAPFYGLLDEEEVREDGSRRFRPIHAGAFQISVQASTKNASLPPGEPPIEDVEAWEVAIFTADARAVSPRSHPHLFRDRRWRVLWKQADHRVGYWSGHYVPTDVLRDLLDCLIDPDGYTQLLTRNILPGQDEVHGPASG
jgi:hypothetical protein